MLVTFGIKGLKKEGEYQVDQYFFSSEKGNWDFFVGNYEFSVDLFENFK